MPKTIVGMTCDPFVRADDYYRRGFRSIVFIHYTEGPAEAKLWETILIDKFKACIDIGNIARGGDGVSDVSKCRGPWFIYCANADSDDQQALVKERAKKACPSL